MKNKLFQPKEKIYLTECATVAGRLEKEGPLGECFDLTFDDIKAEELTWEQAESKMVNAAFDVLMKKASKNPEEIHLAFGGDLMNQCTASSFGIQHLDVPYLGLYGACSTFAQGALLSGIAMEAGVCDNSVFMASSHFSTAERQFRTPLEYGSQRSPTAQCTVTGCCAALLEKERRSDILLTQGLAGIIQDGGITDVSNMGAAMAPAAADTLIRYFSLSGTSPSDFDLIATGDLGSEGHLLTKEILKGSGYPMGDNFTDCGLLIYDRDRQDVHCGGSGCGCSAIVHGGHFFREMKAGNIKDMLLIGTGALMSPLTLMQNLAIPSIAHLVRFTKEEKT